MQAEILFRPARAGEGQILFDITQAAVRARAAGFYAAAQIAGWMAGRDAAAYEALIARGGVCVAEIGHDILGFVDTAPGVITRLCAARADGARAGGAAARARAGGSPVQPCGAGAA